MNVVFRVLRGLLYLARELAGENAYQRHLARCGVAHSAEEWRRFFDERASAEARRPKCC